jgi:hypothetical protein
MIGGVDVVFWVRDERAAVDAILRIARRHWKDYVFQNADDLAPLPRIDDSRTPVPSGDQFFVYRDAAAAASWEDQGAVPENANTMLHVLVGKRRQPGTHFRSLTVVCDELTGEMADMIAEIRAAVSAGPDSGRDVKAQGGMRPDAAIHE